MRRTAIRELNDITSIAVSAHDYDELIASKAYRRHIQLLYGALDGMYGELLVPDMSSERVHFIRGRISALEEVLGVDQMLRAEAIMNKQREAISDDEVPDGDHEFVAALKNNEQGNNHV